MSHHKFYHGDCLEVLRKLDSRSVHCCVTSPPYWGLRDYGVDGQLGLEKTPEEYVAKMVEVFQEVRRVLNPDGTLWLNLGDSYSGSGKGRNPDGTVHVSALTAKQGTSAGTVMGNIFSGNVPHGTKPKDLVGIPWMVAFALRADGWYLRSDIIWAKPNPMPESVTDRPTKAHEYIFLLSKSERYFYDYEAIKEPAVLEGKIVTCGANSRADVDRVPKKNLKQDMIGKRQYSGFNERWANKPCEGRNKRTVWTVPTQPFPDAHFATFPPKLIDPCIKAGCPEGGTVLDPFGGSGTVGMMAKKLGRNSIYIDLNPKYLQMAIKRMDFDALDLFETHTFEVI